jgi:hypothetical protein
MIMCAVLLVGCLEELSPRKKSPVLVQRGWEGEAALWVQERCKKAARFGALGRALAKLGLGLALVAVLGEATGEGRELTEVCYTANLYDSYGDGWDSSKLTITNSDTGVTVQELAQSGNIAKNTAESFSVCIDGCGCFTGQVGGGSYLEEKSWNIQDGAGETIAEASNTGSASFCIACSVCEEGKQPNADDNGCEGCVVGKFSDTAGVAACMNCPAGSYTSTVGAASCQQVSLGGVEASAKRTYR